MCGRVRLVCDYHFVRRVYKFRSEQVPNDVGEAWPNHLHLYSRISIFICKWKRLSLLDTYVCGGAMCFTVTIYFMDLMSEHATCLT